MTDSFARYLESHSVEFDGNDADDSSSEEGKTTVRQNDRPIAHS